MPIDRNHAKFYRERAAGMKTNRLLPKKSEKKPK